MQLVDLGYNETIERFWKENDFDRFEPGRVVEEPKMLKNYNTICNNCD